ncbi:MAG: leucyl aminopeptidase [Deltaproteobacteria bacterium]|nr:leucyl aminopeptidase [Deltaproteobacteria bacterium]
MNTLDITWVKRGLDGDKLGCLAVFAFEDGDPALGLSPALAPLARRAVELKEFTGGKGQTCMLLPPSGDVQRLLLVGLGAADKAERETFRRAAGTVGKTLAGLKIPTAGVLLARGIGSKGVDLGETLAEGLALGAYTFEDYQTKKPEKNEKKDSLKTITLFDPHGAAKEASVEWGLQRARAICLTRDLGNHPSNVLTPTRLAAEAKAVAKRRGLKCTVLGEKEMQKKGMHMLLGVAKGSRQPPQLIVLEHRPRGAKTTLMFVGKGITFDSGGISIKPSAQMDEMKFDMCGAAGVLGAMELIGQAKPPVNVVAVMPACENLPGGLAQKPGDVVRAYNGKTVEVMNTDAEGRLILGDAMAWGIDTYKPDAVVDMATLTGACVVALGHYASGLISNDPALEKKVVQAGKSSGDTVWPLPAFEEYEESIKGKVADIQNIGGYGAGTITGGLFIKHFVGKTPWVHLDIAGTAWGVKSLGHVPNEGATGVGVALLADLAIQWKD